MAVVLDFKVCAGKGCDSLKFNELTGPYSSPSNTTGWGAPNKDNSNPTVANVTVTTPEGDDFVIDALLDGFPTTDNDVQLVITAAELGYGDKLTDGLYTIKYDVTVIDTGTFSYSVTKYFLVACNIKCCIDGMFTAIVEADCDNCNDDRIAKALKAYALYKGLQSAAICGDRSAVTKILTRLNKLCTVTNCNCG